MNIKEVIRGGYYDAAVQLMDDEIRKEVHRDLAPCTDEEFLTEYCKRHEEVFGEEFTIDGGTITREKKRITAYIRGNMSRAEFSRRYGIPVRTLEDWDAGKSTAPDYVINLLARAVYEDRMGCLVWFAVYNCTEGSKGTPFHDEALIISTENILDALKMCGKGTDKNYYDELRVYTQNPLDENFESFDCDIVEWKEITR